MNIKKLFIPLFFFYVIPVFSQNSVSLDKGLGNAAKYFVERLEPGAKVILLNFTAPAPQLAEYVLEELTAHIVNDGSLVVVDRKNLEMLDQELQFQLSGEVDDDTILSIGKKLGAQIIISGSMEPLGNLFRLRVRAISVETAVIKGINTATIQRDRILSSLTEIPRAASRAAVQDANSPADDDPSALSPSGRGDTSDHSGGSSVTLPEYLRSR
jgi:TolB-like protein